MVCVCTCVCVMCVQVHIHMLACRGRGTASGSVLQFYLSLLWSGVSLLHWYSPSRLDWGTVCLSVSASTAHDLPPLAFFFLVWALGLKSGPLACQLSTLVTAISLAPGKSLLFMSSKRGCFVLHSRIDRHKSPHSWVLDFNNHCHGQRASEALRTAHFPQAPPLPPPRF